MQIYKRIGLDLEKQNVISFVGAGGKSTSMNALAGEFKDMGKKVLITTTTMLFEPAHRNNDKFIVGEIPNEYKPGEGTITLLAKSISGEKIEGLDPKELEEIYNRNIFDVILLEADGAKRKPIKAPAGHEPVVPNISTMTIGLIGLDSIGRDLDEENTHRPELLRKIFDVELPHKLEAEDIVKLIIDENGIFKGSHGREVIFLNKVDKDKLLEMGKEIREKLYKKNVGNIYITNMIESKIY